MTLYIIGNNDKPLFRPAPSDRPLRPCPHPITRHQGCQKDERDGLGPGPGLIYNCRRTVNWEQRSTPTRD
jgi:hypothetical protein